MKHVVRDHFTNTDNWPGIECRDPSLTDQSQADDCDVNNIVDRFMKTGVMPGHDEPGRYDDFSSVQSYHDAMGVVASAQQQFDSLDARARKRFNNDPATFLEFANDPKNVREMVDLGLATERPESSNLAPAKGLKTPPPAIPDPAPAKAGKNDA